MSTCYFGAEACARGHLPDCPARDGDVWGETTRETATPMPSADEAAPGVAPPRWYQDERGNWRQRRQYVCDAMRFAPFKSLFASEDSYEKRRK